MQHVRLSIRAAMKVFISDAVLHMKNDKISRANYDLRNCCYVECPENTCRGTELQRSNRALHQILCRGSRKNLFTTASVI